MEPPKRLERQVAKPHYITEILTGELIAGEGNQANVLRSGRGDAGRISVIGIVVSAEELPTASVTLDDGTGTLTVRSFERALPFSPGDCVHVIGRPRTYQREPYVAAETVVRVVPDWMAVRKKELGEPKAPVEPTPLPPIATEQRETNAEKVIKLIIKLDRGDGAAVQDIIAESKIRDVDALIEQLLLAGDIFELRPGKVKVL